jgi:hypothetical protein
LVVADTEQIYVELLDDGVQVWAPVVAEKLADDLYQLPEVSPGDQIWAFAPGSVVRCETQATGLVAVEAVRP